jgi:hypothetical protein
MIFKIVSPMITTIDGDSLKEAIKNFIKINHNLNITNMIIRDQTNNIQAKINYYKEDGRNKVGINMFPVGLEYPIPVVTNGSYIPQNVIQPPNNSWSISPSHFSPQSFSQFVPSVIKIPTNL